MRINFFEEFPTTANLSKSKLIKFPSTIFIAAKSIKKYNKYKNLVKTSNRKLDTCYWPILKKSYWISNFSSIEEINNLINEITTYPDKKSLKLMLDLEILPKPYIILTGLLNYSKNKKVLANLFNTITNLKIHAYSAEYFFPYIGLRKVFKFLGVNPNQNLFPRKQIIMCYKSNPMDNLFYPKLITAISKYTHTNNSPILGIGIIGVGAFGPKYILSPKNLNDNLQDLESNGIKEAVVFRLGGINNEYLKVLEKYT